jgi:hypothetical protein
MRDPEQTIGRNECKDLSSANGVSYSSRGRSVKLGHQAQKPSAVGAAHSQPTPKT